MQSSMINRTAFPGLFSPFEEILKYSNDLGSTVKAAATDVFHAPNYRVVNVDEDTVRIIINAAGFTRDELEISATLERLVVSGKQKDKTNALVEDFELKFKIPKGKELSTKAASFENGLLTLEFSFTVPEADKPRLIPID